MKSGGWASELIKWQCIGGKVRRGNLGTVAGRAAGSCWGAGMKSSQQLPAAHVTATWAAIRYDPPSLRHPGTHTAASGPPTGRARRRLLLKQSRET